jgi:hypothetical protein
MEPERCRWKLAEGGAFPTVYQCTRGEGHDGTHICGEREWSEPELAFDPVNRPKHYADRGIEVIDYIEDCGWGLAFCLGNAVKYISRAGRKDPEKLVEDLEKARWYLDRAIAGLKKEKT